MKIRCDNGLCDRLRFIFSYLKKVSQTNEELIVCWLENIKCNGHFLDIFKPIPKLVFTDDTANCDIFDWKPCTGFDPRDQFIYDGLDLLDHLVLKIDTLISAMGKDFISIHVRRTDKVTYNGLNKLTSDKAFFNFIDKHADKKVFLATDDRTVQLAFKEKYPERIFYHSEIMPTEDFRQTSLEVAALDLFTCIKANRFFGTNLSGYSEFISQFRQRLNTKKKFFI